MSFGFEGSHGQNYEYHRPDEPWDELALAEIEEAQALPLHERVEKARIAFAAGPDASVEYLMGNGLEDQPADAATIEQ